MSGKRKPRKKAATKAGSASVDKLVVVSDTHCGSTLGLLHPGFITNEGNGVEQNRIQQWLWAMWRDLWYDWVPSIVGKSSFAVVINGDLVDGLHHRTTQVVSPDFGDHIRIAQQCMVPIRKLSPDAIFVTEGTESHTRNSETTLGEIIGAEKDPNTDRYAFPRLDLDICDTRCTFFHHTATTSRSYLESGDFSRTLGNERIEAVRAGLPVARVIGMAHRHRHGLFCDGEGMAFTTGAFQALTRYGMKVVPSAVPAPSCFILDWSLHGPGKLPQVYQKVYTATESERKAVEV